MRTGRTRPILAAILAVACATLAVATPIATTPEAHAVTALIMGGSFQPNPATIPNYLADTERLYIDPHTTCKIETCDLAGLVTPEQFWPGYGKLTFDQSVAKGVAALTSTLVNRLVTEPAEPMVIYGSSQSAVIASIVKHNLADVSSGIKSQLAFVLTGNPDRPNGGILARFAPLTIPIFGFTANGPAPTGTGIATTDISFQYDIAGDFPQYPLNIFALLNSLIGINTHGGYLSTHDGYTEPELEAAIADPDNRQTVAGSDTTYVTIPTKELPLVMPLRAFGAMTGTTAMTTPLADLIEPTLRVLVELGYDRGLGYGTPATAGLFPTINPQKLVNDLSAAVAQGVTAAVADVTAGRSPAAAGPTAVTPPKAAARSATPRPVAARTAAAAPKHQPAGAPGRVTSAARTNTAAVGSHPPRTSDDRARPR
jgi:PE-PPE domain